MNDFNKDSNPSDPRAGRPRGFEPGNRPRPPHHDRGGRGGWAGKRWDKFTNDEFTAEPTSPPRPPMPPFGHGPFAAMFDHRTHDGRGVMPGHYGGTLTIGRGSAGGARTPRGGIRLGLLALLAEKSQNGSQLMKTFEKKSNGRWTPKPGTVYPALAHLLEEGLADVDDDGVYSLTKSGQLEAQKNRVQTDALFKRMAEGEADVDLFEAAAGLAKALLIFKHEANSEQKADVAAKTEELRKYIYRTLGKQGVDES